MCESLRSSHKETARHAVSRGKPKQPECPGVGADAQNLECMDLSTLAERDDEDVGATAADAKSGAATQFGTKTQTPEKKFREKGNGWSWSQSRSWSWRDGKHYQSTSFNESFAPRAGCSGARRALGNPRGRGCNGDVDDDRRRPTTTDDDRRRPTTTGDDRRRRRQ